MQARGLTHACPTALDSTLSLPPFLGPAPSSRCESVRNDGSIWQTCRRCSAHAAPRSCARSVAEDGVRLLGQRRAPRAGRRLDDASPWVAARLPVGTRLHAVLAPVSRPGTVISLRIGAQRRFDLADLSAMLGPRGTQILRS